MPRRIAQYQVLERIGLGGLGEMYAGRDEKRNRPVVLKILHPDRLADENARRWFVREARSAAALANPYIGSIYDVLDVAGQLVIVAEHVHGQTVLERVAAGPFEPREVVCLGRELAEGLAAVHARGFMCRELSASNVAVTADGHLKLMDFGLAHLLEITEENPAVPTPQVDVHSRTMLLGTPVYMAPELLNGGQATTRSDLYAAGVVLYLMSTGRLPFAERMTPASLAEMLIQPPVPPSLLVAGVPASLERAIMRLLEKKPEARFPSAESLAAAI
jgi:eukaryotic-like serine/threonine-protein kinase